MDRETNKRNIMTTDQLLDALAPFAVDLSYAPVAGVWAPLRGIILMDWNFLHTENADKHAASWKPGSARRRNSSRPPRRSGFSPAGWGNCILTQIN